MPTFDRSHDARVRAAAFEWLAGQVDLLGDVLPWKVLSQGFQLDGVRVPLLGPQGIFRPAVLRHVPLSITTSPDGPYDDTFGIDTLLHYRYRGEDPLHRDNVGLRTAMQLNLPLVYFYGIVKGRYVAAWPVYIVGDDPARLSFTVAVDDAEHVGLTFAETGLLAVRDPFADEGRRRYVTALVRRRLHQRSFRERVLRAYRSECAFCRLRHEELLDAAHISPDSDESGEPVISNGLALCKLHHAAFDQGFLGVRPDYVVEVRSDLLTEKDGPTLVHGIQSMEGRRIFLPRVREHWPSEERLARRYEVFRVGRRVS
jgi:putative restriction endonuclease